MTEPLITSAMWKDLELWDEEKQMADRFGMSHDMYRKFKMEQVLDGFKITSAMWKEDKQKALNVAIAHHLRALQASMFALRDENGNRPDFDLEDMVNAIYESMVLSRAEIAKFHAMVAENQRKVDAERLNKVEKLEFANGELKADLSIMRMELSSLKQILASNGIKVEEEVVVNDEDEQR